jgi:hypothetical protein
MVGSLTVGGLQDAPGYKESGNVFSALVFCGKHRLLRRSTRYLEKSHCDVVVLLEYMETHRV